MAWWLFKTEPDTYSIDHLARDGEAPWDGIRNYQARNRLRDEVAVGDQVFIHHSSCKVPAIVGIARVCSAAEADLSQFNPHCDGFDPKSTPDAPRWVQVSLRYLRHLESPLSLSLLRSEPALASMELLKRPRLSVQKVSSAEARHILALAKRQQC